MGDPGHALNLPGTGKCGASSVEPLAVTRNNLPEIPRSRRAQGICYGPEIFLKILQ